eukprot:581588-Pyramimonas_sp.AAC.1
MRSTASRGPIGNSTEGPSSASALRGPIWAPPNAPVGVPACVRPTQYSVSRPHRGLHQRPQWGCPH